MGDELSFVLQWKTCKELAWKCKLLTNTKRKYVFLFNYLPQSQDSPQNRELSFKKK